MAYIGAGISRFNTADELTVTGDAQIDGNTLVVDSTNNRVGVNNASPSTALDVSGTVNATAYTGDGSSLTGISTDLVNDTTPQLGGNLDTNGNNINFGDNDRARFGAGTDLQIYHSSSDDTSYIFENGGTLSVQATNFNVLDGSGSNMLTFTNNDGPDLYHNGSKKLEVTSTGVDVTGTVTADGATIEGNNTGVSYKANSRAFFGSLQSSHFAVVGGAAKADETANSRMIATETSTGNGLPSAIQLGAGNIDFHTIASSTANAVFDSKRMRVDKNGDISFYDSTGTTQGLFWDASTQRLGLGMTSPNWPLNISQSGGNTRLELNRSDVNTSGVVGAISFTASDEHSVAAIDVVGDGDNEGGHLRFLTTSAASSNNHYTSTSEAMRITSGNHLLVGKTAQDSTNTVGFEAKDTGEIAATVDGGATAFFNRKTSNGDVAVFRKDNTTVGSVSVTGSGTTYNTTSDLRLKTDIEPIDHATDMLMAMNPVSHRWKADPDADAVVGFIAQEMQEIVPEAVSGDADSDEMMAMDYGRITPVLVAALQDAHKKIEQLEQRIADMENN